jgi:hypothetical protein
VFTTLVLTSCRGRCISQFQTIREFEELAYWGRMQMGPIDPGPQVCQALLSAA